MNHDQQETRSLLNVVPDFQSSSWRVAVECHRDHEYFGYSYPQMFIIPIIKSRPHFHIFRGKSISYC